MKNETIISSIILIILFIIIIKYIYKTGKYIKSQIDNKEYFVEDNEDKQLSADTLAQIRKNINLLVQQIKNNPKPEYKEYINELDKKIKNIDISENTSNIYTSYSINKQELVFCLKSKVNHKIHNMNLLMYVVIHEVAHLMCPEYGHGQLFKEIFSYLLDNAQIVGIYTPIDFQNEPKEYCGMNINYG